MLALPAGADMYKWTDPQGKVHYGDQPLSATTPLAFDPKTSKAAEARAQELRRQIADQEARKRVEQAKTKEATAKPQVPDEEETRRKAENCQRARGNLELLQRTNIRLTTVNAQGQAQMLDAAGRQAEMERAAQIIAENCPN